MSNMSSFDFKKAIEVLLYITERCNNVYNALKVLYFADKDHLAKYGRLICGERYIAMEHGPVPSGVYDIVKYVRGNGIFELDNSLKDTFVVRENNIFPTRAANRDLLSESDIQALDNAIRMYSTLSFPVLRSKSHDMAFKSASVNDEITLENIIRSLPNSEELLEYVLS